MSRADNLAAQDKAVHEFVLEGEISEAEMTDGAVQGRRWFSLRRLRFGFDVSLATNGYIVFPFWLGGLILQWGYSESAPSERAVAFPLAFPSTCLTAISSLGRNPGQPGGESAGAYQLTPTGMTIFLRDDGPSTPGYWLAIGC